MLIENFLKHVAELHAELRRRLPPGNGLSLFDSSHERAAIGGWETHCDHDNADWPLTGISYEPEVVAVYHWPFSDGGVAPAEKVAEFSYDEPDLVEKLVAAALPDTPEHRHAREIRRVAEAMNE